MTVPITQSGATLRQGGLEAIAALFSTFLVFALNQFVPGLDVFVIIMSSLIVLVGGMLFGNTLLPPRRGH